MYDLFDGVNVEVVHKISESMLELAVYERGAGKTLACATEHVQVLLQGIIKAYVIEKLQFVFLEENLIHWQDSDNHVVQIGPTSCVFKGELTL